MAVVETKTELENKATEFDNKFAELVWELQEKCRSIHFVVGSRRGAVMAEQLSKNVDVLASFCALAGSKPIERIASESLRSEADLVVGIGGGSVIDRAKVAAKAARTPLLVIPTVLSQDGLYSQHAVIRSRSGGVERFTCASPDGVLPAADLIEAAPRIFSQACVGDLISNFSAIDDCKLAARGGRYNTSEMALAMAREAAEIAASWKPHSKKMELFPAVQLSGKAMLVAGDSSPCSGAEHKIVSALEQLGISTPHGIAVALATVFVSALRDSNAFESILSIARTHGLPTLPADIGIDAEQFVEAAMLAATLRRSRYTILDTREFTRADFFQTLEFVETFQREGSTALTVDAKTCLTP